MNKKLFLIAPDNLISRIINRGLDFEKYISMDVTNMVSDKYISIYNYINNYSNDIIIIPAVICDEFNIDGLYKELIDIGIEDEKIRFLPFEFYYNEDNISIKDLKKYDDISFLNYLEICINDNCNMNCKGCSHFANLAPKEYNNYENVKKDFIRLRKLFSHIDKIRIMGGEPLLNSELIKYIKMIKSIYPNTDLRIVTNGLLLKNISEELIECIRINNVMLDISVYPPMIKSIDSIIDMLRKRNVKIFIENIGKFKPILLKKKTKYPYKKLNNCNCINLRDGFLASCPLVFTIKYLNNKYNDAFNYSLHKIDIYQEDITAKEIKEQLLIPFELCDYCAHYRDDLEFFNWEQRKNNFSLEDWVYEEKNGDKTM